MRADDGAVHGARVDEPSVVVDRLARGPGALFVPRDVDVTDLVVGAITEDGDRTVGRDRHAGRAAVAHLQIDAAV